MKTARILFEELNSGDENVKIEAKRSSEVGKSILETVCAFANEPDLGGGYLLLGAVRKGFDEQGFPVYEPENIVNPDKVQSDLANQCASVFNIRLRPQIKQETFEGKTVIIVKVEEVPAAHKPVYFEKRGLPQGAYRRIGSTDQKCTEEDLSIFYSSADSIETVIVKGSSLDDVDENAVSYYRKLRKQVNPAAEELAYEDTELLLALKACEKDFTGNYVLTNVGLIVFGKSMALRRLMPALRVDYIRVPGNRWVESSDKRFEHTIDMRGAFILLVNRAVNAITDDLPKGFELKGDNLQAFTPIDIPNDTLREAIVNAFMHRSFRVNRPIQIIRYSNRIEITNPGFSLKSPEHLGEPGSELRNPFISAIFHDTNLAETKGSGIRSMRDQMKTAHLMPPTFESNRETNLFTVRLLLHHLLGEEDVKWLALFANFELNNEQRLSLIFMRELGAIDNITYRQLNSDITTRKASFDLHRMCEKGLFELKGQGKNAYYIAGSEFIQLNSKGDGEMYGGNKEMYGGNEEIYGGNGEMYGGNGEMYGADGEIYGGNEEMYGAEDLPDELKERVAKIGKRTTSSDMRSLIIDLCAFQPLGLAEMASMLHRNKVFLRNHYLNPLMEQNQLFYTIPEMIKHPKQKYTTKKEK